MNEILKQEQALGINCPLCLNYKSSIFFGLESSAMEKLTEHSYCIHFLKGQDIIKEGTRVQGVYCIMSGKAKSYRLLPDGREIVIKLHRPSDIIGYANICNSNTYVNSASCLEDITGCFIPLKVILSVLDENIALLKKFFHLSCSDNIIYSQVIFNLKSKNVRGRVALSILQMEEIYDRDAEGYINISLTREEIAQMAGTNRESVVRFIHEFKKEKLIQNIGKKIKILDKVKLKTVTEF